MTDTAHTTIPNTIKLDGVLWPVKGVIGMRDLARFENRIVFGDPSKDDDELLATKVWNDFSGGCGIYDEKEGADQGTFWDAQGLDIDHPNQLALGPRVQSFTIGGTNAFVLGSRTNVYLSFDKNVYVFDESTDTVSDTTYNLAFNPVNKAVAYDSVLWVPYGADGYETFSAGSGTTTGTAGITPVAFCEWDNKLAAIEHDGQLSLYDVLLGAWDSPSTAKLNASITPRDIVSYYNRSDEPSLYVVTTDGLYGYDPIPQTFVRTNMQFPKHPDNGKGAAVWRTGESLYIAASMGIYAWTGPGGTASPVGLDRKQGIPAEYLGHIVDLSPSLNHLWALIDGDTTSGFHSLYRFNGGGWVRMWAHTNNTDTINWSHVSGSNSTQRIWWDVGNDIYSIELPRGFANPREIVASGSGKYGTDGYLITSWFDANMPAFDKLFAYVYSLALNGEEGEIFIPPYYRRVEVSYQTDKTDEVSDSWTSVNYIASTGNFAYHFTNFSAQQIRFKFTFVQSGYNEPLTVSPVLDSSVAKFMKVPTSYKTWQVTFDMNFEGMTFDRDAQQMANDLDELLVKKTLITMEHNQNTYFVRVSNEQGWDGTAEDRKKSRTATFVEIRYPGPSELIA